MKTRWNVSLRMAGLAVVSLVAMAGTASAQLGIELKLDRQYYLSYEVVSATVTLRNYTGNTLIFGGTGPGEKGSFLHFLMRRGSEKLMPVTQGAKPLGDLILGAGETRRVTLVLNDLYNLQPDGKYVVSAQIGHFRLPQDYRSAEQHFEVSRGTMVWNRTVGVPGADAAARIESRQVSLLLLRERLGSVYCLRIENEQMVFAVIRLGAQFMGSAPEIDIDAVSNIHVLFQLRSRLFAHRVYDCRGRVREDKHFLMEKTVPHLYRDAELGRIMVQGGSPWNKKDDERLDEASPLIPDIPAQNRR
jgi:hypothetical protein